MIGSTYKGPDGFWTWTLRPPLTPYRFDHQTCLVVHDGGAFFRIRGYGLSIKNQRKYRPLFSERHWTKKHRAWVDIGHWRIRVLTEPKRKTTGEP